MVVVALVGWSGDRVGLAGNQKGVGGRDGDGEGEKRKRKGKKVMLVLYGIWGGVEMSCDDTSLSH